MFEIIIIILIVLIIAMQCLPILDGSVISFMIRMLFYSGEFIYFFMRYGFSTAREKAIPPWKEDSDLEK